MMLRCATVKFMSKVRQPGGATERGIAPWPRCRTRGRVLPRRPRTGQRGAEPLSMRTYPESDHRTISEVSTSRSTAINARFSIRFRADLTGG